MLVHHRLLTSPRPRPRQVSLPVPWYRFGCREANRQAAEYLAREKRLSYDREIINQYAILLRRFH